MISRRITPHRTGRRFITAFAVAGLLAGTILASGAVLATPFPVGVGVQNTGLFQLDGNTLPVTCGPADDWAALWTIAPNGDHPCGSGSFSFINDRTGTTGDTTYWNGGGSKDAYDPALGPWLVKSNDVSPDKNDLVNAFAAIYQYDPTGLNIPVLFFGADRFNTNGDAQMGFQFLQSAACIAATPGSVPGEEGYCPASTPNQGANSGKFVDPTAGTPIHHQNHDLLILVNFNNGGTLGLAGVYEWTGANGAGAGSFSVVLSSGTGATNPPADCKTITGSNDFCATATTANLPGEPVWPYSAKGVSGQATYGPSSFIEGGVNLSRISNANLCFPSFLAETRSSAGPSTGLSLQAQLKDLAFGQFQQCGAGITINPSAVNEVGQTHTFTVHVTKSQGGVAVPAAGVFPNVTLTTSNGAVVTDKVDGCASPGGTNASGNCTVSFTSNSTGVVTGHATASVVIGSSTFNVATDGVSPNSGDAVKRFVDAKIGVTPLTATNEVNHEHTITATVQQDDGLAANATGGDAATGFGPAPAGTLVTFSLANNLAGATFVGGVSTCTTVGTTGQCNVKINTTTAGDVDIHATTTFSVGGVSLTRSTGSGGNNSADANKVYVDAYIVINPPEASNTVGDAHTFTVTVYKDDGLAAAEVGGDGVTGFTPATVGNVDVTLTNDATSSYVIDLNASTCDNNQPSGDNLDNNGQCTVVFTSSTAGTVTGHASVSLVVGGVTLTRSTNGTAPNSGDAIKHFVSGSLKWTKVDNAGNLQGGATFTVCKTKNYDLTTGTLVAITPVCNDILDNQAGPPADADADNGEFELVGLSLGEYTVVEKTAPPGFVKDPDTITVDLVPGDTNKTIGTAFVNTREVLKITGFGYTNSPQGTPTSGVVSGTAIYTFKLHNYGSAVANLTNSSLVASVTGAGTGTLTCNGSGTGGLTLAVSPATVAVGADSATYTLTCTYTNMADLAKISALLTIKSTTNGLEREASGSPATITFTVQSD